MYPFFLNHFVKHNMYDNLMYVLYYDQVGCTPLHRAASTGKSDVCELLIEEGAEVDAVDRSGQTPLMNAVICENKEVCLFCGCKYVFMLHNSKSMTWHVSTVFLRNLYIFVEDKISIDLLNFEFLTTSPCLMFLFEKFLSTCALNKCIWLL